MKHLLAPAFALAAGPALAHSGAHVHPHGAEVWIALVIAAVVVGGGISWFRSRR